jgi:hypothetical protein
VAATFAASLMPKARIQHERSSVEGKTADSQRAAAKRASPAVRSASHLSCGSTLVSCPTRNANSGATSHLMSKQSLPPRASPAGARHETTRYLFDQPSAKPRGAFAALLKNLFDAPLSSKSTEVQLRPFRARRFAVAVCRNSVYTAYGGVAAPSRLRFEMVVHPDSNDIACGCGISRGVLSHRESVLRKLIMHVFCLRGPLVRQGVFHANADGPAVLPIG